MKPEDIERIKDLLPTSLGSAEIREKLGLLRGRDAPAPNDGDETGRGRLGRASSRQVSRTSPTRSTAA